MAIFHNQRRWVFGKDGLQKNEKICRYCRVNIYGDSSVDSFIR